MTSEDFLKIFYSNFSPNIDWANIDEIAWMYQEGLLKLSSKILADHGQFEERLDQAASSKEALLTEGESLTHLVLKTFAANYLVDSLGVPRADIVYEYPLIGFEVDVIDKSLCFPIECGDTNALKLEKFLSLSTTKSFLILPYPHLEDLKIFEFQAKPRFFEYINHKQNFLNRKNASLR
jgi:hypothetical protein